MRTLLLSIVYLAFCFKSYAQKRSAYSPIELKAMYPFYAAAQVKLASFWIGSRPETVQHSNSIPKNGEVIALDELDEMKTLSRSAIDSLAEILYNTCFKTNDTRYPVGRCFLPRNAIVFFNKKQEAFAWIEVCFECTGVKPSSPQIKLEPLCDTSYRELQRFFREHHILTSEYELVDD
jgi:hypothetical protein